MLHEAQLFVRTTKNLMYSSKRSIQRTFSVVFRSEYLQIKKAIRAGIRLGNASSPAGKFSHFCLSFPKICFSESFMGEALRQLILYSFLQSLLRCSLSSTDLRGMMTFKMLNTKTLVTQFL